MSDKLIAVIILIYLFGCGLKFILTLHMEGEFDEIPWWPIQMVKALAKSFVRVVFTGWRP